MDSSNVLTAWCGGFSRSLQLLMHPTFLATPTTASTALMLFFLIEFTVANVVKG
jgi:hypothetical protein